MKASLLLIIPALVITEQPGGPSDMEFGIDAMTPEQMDELYQDQQALKEANRESAMNENPTPTPHD